MATRIGIDTGGTFTDVIRIDRRALSVFKVPSTPSDPGRAVLDGLATARRSPEEEVDVVHGTTVGLNAALTGTLARTAFVTNAGFEDLIEVGRQDRSDIYALEPSRPHVPVPRELRFGVQARRDPMGRRLAGFAEGELDALRDRLGRARVDAVAVGLLHSPVRDQDERAVRKALRPLGIPVTTSAALSSYPAEFERFATAILNAGMTPGMGAYTGRLSRSVRPGQLRLLRSSGGILPGREAQRHPAIAAFSGPAGGVMATAALTRAEGFAHAAAFDMGGTSTDVSLVDSDGAVDAGALPDLAGIPLALPSVRVHTVGCGGGSIAYADAGGALRVGPQSAGADPGPACYGRGDDPTVTDAHMALGHMGPDTLLGGTFPVDVDRSVHAIERLAQRLGLDTRTTAEGILEVAEVAMRRALMVITAEQATDPSTVALVAYGGAGGLHAARLARALRMPCALVPAAPGAFSAVGLALAGEVEEHQEAVLTTWSAERERTMRARAKAVAAEQRQKMHGRARTRVSVGCRYEGQGTFLEVPLTTATKGSLADTFAALHEHRYGFLLEETPIELVHLHVRTEQPHRTMPTTVAGAPTAAPATKPSRRRAPVGGTPWTVHQRGALPVGSSVQGPCLIEELTGVTVVPDGTCVAIGESALRLTNDP